MTLSDFAGTTIATMLGASPHVVATVEHVAYSAGHWVIVHSWACVIALRNHIADTDPPMSD
jgi:hypothetical protein